MSLSNWIKLIVLILTVGTGAYEKEQERQEAKAAIVDVISEDYIADYDGDGEEETIWYSWYDETGGLAWEDLDPEKPGCGYMTVWYEDGEESILVDTFELHERGMYWSGHGDIYDAIEERNGQPVLKISLLNFGSNGWGYYKQIFYGVIDGNPIKIKEEEGWGSKLGTVYLYDGSVREVEDPEFVQFIQENIWMEDKDSFYDTGYECDMDGDGEMELFLQDEESVYDRTPEGIVKRFEWECPPENGYYTHCVLLEDGGLMAYYETFGEASEEWFTVYYHFDEDWNVMKDVECEVYFDPNDLEDVGEEERKHLSETYFPDVELASVPRGRYLFWNGACIEKELYEEEE